MIVYKQPEQYSLAYNDMVLVFKTPIHTDTLRYKVALRNSNGDIISTQTVFPTVNTFGGDEQAYTDIKRIIQSKVGHDVTIPTTTHSGFLKNTNSHFEYDIVLTAEDKNAQGLYVTTDVWISELKSAWNGGIDVDDWLDFDYNDYLMTTGVGATNPLTDNYEIREINTGDSAAAYFVGGMINAPKYAQIITYPEYNGQGTQINAETITNVESPSMQFYSSRYLRLMIGPSDIDLLNPSYYSGADPTTLLDGAKSYTVTLTDNSSNIISAPMMLNIDRLCDKYTPIRLQWLNRLGGMEAFNCNLMSEEETKSDKSTFRQGLRTKYAESWDYTKASRGKTVYDVQNTKTLKVNTGYLSDANSEWMEELFTSPIVYQEINSELISVVIDGRRIKKQTSLNNKLNQYTFNLEYSKINTRQRG